MKTIITWNGQQGGMSEPYHDGRVYHLAKLITTTGTVSPLCARIKPRALNMKKESWTIQHDAVTCKKCRTLIDSCDVRPAGDTAMSVGGDVDGDGDGDGDGEWRVRAQDWQTATEWLARRVDALQPQLAAKDAAIQQTVMLYQSRIDALLRRLGMMTGERDRLEALMDDPRALAASLVERQKGKPYEDAR